MTFCVHRMHCKECHEQDVLLVRSHLEAYAALEREYRRFRLDAKAALDEARP